MDIFPAQYSTLSAAALKTFIEKVYGFELITCRLLVRNVSDTYILESPETKFIFKIYRTHYRSFDEIKGEVELLNLLKANGAPVSYPIPDLNGAQVQLFNAAEGTRHGVLFSFAIGKVVPDPDEQQLKMIGKNIALMHNITSGCILPFERIVYNTETTLNRPLQIIKHRFADLPDEYNDLCDLAKKVIHKLNQFETSGFSVGYCHYDLLSKNFHFDEANHITFFDFDWMGNGYLANDLMTFRVQLFFLAHLNMITQEEADERFMVFVDAYRDQRPFSKQEQEAIPYLGIMFWIFAFGFYEDNFDDFSNTFLGPRFIKDRVALIKKWAGWYCDF